MGCEHGAQPHHSQLPRPWQLPEPQPKVGQSRVCTWGHLSCPWWWEAPFCLCSLSPQGAGDWGQGRHGTWPRPTHWGRLCVHWGPLPLSFPSLPSWGLGSCSGRAGQSAPYLQPITHPVHQRSCIWASVLGSRAGLAVPGQSRGPWKAALAWGGGLGNGLGLCPWALAGGVGSRAAAEQGRGCWRVCGRGFFRDCGF